MGTILGPLDQNSIVDGAAGNSMTWTVGDIFSRGITVNNGRGRFAASEANERFFQIKSQTALRAEEELEKHGARLAVALGLDRVQRILDVSMAPWCEGNSNKSTNPASTTQWNGSEWIEGLVHTHQKPLKNKKLPLPPFK